MTQVIQSAYERRLTAFLVTTVSIFPLPFSHSEKGPGMRVSVHTLRARSAAHDRAAA